jgi:hypothetical protein
MAAIAQLTTPLISQAAISRNPSTRAEKLAYEFLLKAASVDHDGFDKKLYCSDRNKNLAMVALYFRHESDVRPQLALVHQQSSRYGTTKAPVLINLSNSKNVTTKQGFASGWDSNLSLAFRHAPSTVNMRFELYTEQDSQGRVGMWVGRARESVGPSVGCFPKAKQAAEWMLSRPLVQTVTTNQARQLSQFETL